MSDESDVGRFIAAFTPATLADLQAMELRVRRALGHLTEAVEDLADGVEDLHPMSADTVRRGLAKVRKYALTGEDDAQT